MKVCERRTWRPRGYTCPPDRVPLHFREPPCKKCSGDPRGRQDNSHTIGERPLHLDAPTFRMLLELQGPSLGLWRAAEIAVLREQVYEQPVLDLGCGDGLVTSYVLSKVEVGLDPDEKVLAQAAERGIYERFEAIPAEEIPLPDESMGTIVSNSVLEHLLKIDAVLEQVARVLRPG